MLFIITFYLFIAVYLIYFQLNGKSTSIFDHFIIEYFQPDIEY